MTAAVIYIFRCPRGRVYAGRHAVSPEALRCWPGRGEGPLPDGYTGSGTYWQDVARRHRAALVWRILARVEGDHEALVAAERRAIRLARAVFGQDCVNLHEGGDGYTPEQARAQAARNYARPEYLAKLRAARLALSADPAWQEKIAARNRARGKDPEFRRKVSVAHKGRTKSPSHQARVAAANRCPEKRQAQKVAAAAQWSDPERAARLKAGIHRAQQRKRARRELAPFVQTPAWLAPGAVLWAYRPPPRLALWPGRQK